MATTCDGCGADIPNREPLAVLRITTYESGRVTTAGR